MNHCHGGNVWYLQNNCVGDHSLQLNQQSMSYYQCRICHNEYIWKCCFQYVGHVIIQALIDKSKKLNYPSSGNSSWNTMNRYLSVKTWMESVQCRHLPDLDSNDSQTFFLSHMQYMEVSALSWPTFIMMNDGHTQASKKTFSIVKYMETYSKFD